MYDYYITKPLLDKLALMIDFGKLNLNQVPGTFNYQNKCFIPVVAYSNKLKGFTSVTCHQLIPLESYKGDVEPKHEEEHFDLVLQGKRERGYNARLLNKDSKKYVMIDPKINFEPLEKNKQLSLF